MKKQSLLSLLFFIFSYSCQLLSNVHDDHLLAVVIMVKNEVDVIIPTLKPFVDAGLQSFLVFDTGSTDGTQEKIRDYFKESSVDDAHIIEEPFIDFATSRNRALDLAEEIFSDHTFLLMLDAEWYTHDVQTLINFCIENKNYIMPGSTGSCYSMRLFTVQDEINNYITRLIRVGHSIRYTGVVHETIREIASGTVPDSAYFEYAPEIVGREKSNARLARDYALLKKSHTDNPENTRTLFYLAQTCQFLDAWDEAIFYYKKRLELGELSEEKYLAAYRIGYAIEVIMQESKNKNIESSYRWEDALHYYLMAHSILPSRAEPLFRIACYYIRNNLHAVAYLFAIRAVQLPYPQKNGMFVEKRIYDYLRYDILGQCALYAGEFMIGKHAVLKAMETVPNDPSLCHNLEIYNYYIAS